MLVRLEITPLPVAASDGCSRVGRINRIKRETPSESDNGGHPRSELGHRDEGIPDLQSASDRGLGSIFEC